MGGVREARWARRELVVMGSGGSVVWLEDVVLGLVEVDGVDSISGEMWRCWRCGSSDCHVGVVL